jgi:probable HAF family extracellular repeat protein
MKPFTPYSDACGRRFSFMFFRLLAICSLCLMTTTLASAQSYTVTNLGTLGGSGAGSGAYGINDIGQVTGYAFNAIGNTTAFLWQNGHMTDLGIGTQYSTGLGINDNGVVVGTAGASGGQVQTFLWQNRTFTDLTALAGAAQISGINNLGQVGVTFFSGGNLHGYVWQNGTLTDIGTLPGATGTWLSAINNSGMVTGYAYFDSSAGLSHAFLWQQGYMTDLGALPGALYSDGYGINDNGDVVGDSYAGNVVPHDHAVLWQANGVIQDLGYGYATAINNQRQIIGMTEQFAPFLWQNGVMTNLNNLIPSNSGWVLLQAFAINNAGQIVGDGTYQGQTRAFLLTPNGNGAQGPPVLITNVSACNISFTGATISWNTNVATNSTIEYGYTDSYGSSVSTPASVTNHSLTLNLLPDRLYHYRVTSTTATGQTATSADQTFVTVAGPDFYMSYANLHKDPYGRYLIDLTFTNQGGANIPDIEVYGATLGSATPLSPNLPLPKFGLTTNASYTVTMTFPGTAGSSGASAPLKVGTALYDGFGNLLGYVAFNYLRILLP